MSNTIIKVESVSKSYILKHQTSESYTTLRDVIANKTKNIFSSKSDILNPSREEFWALKDVSFDVNQGDRVGIIGRNGAGKSTLLKILSRIVTPTSGRITIEGRVASLLEVGTGFHPELSGRENIFLNGSILGMNKAEIKSKFDEIVTFSEVERFLDTPVKRYSSGMYVRLAFAVAAHLDPEILIVDEVLAVGDAAFQKKCLGKMKDVSSEGRTVLFVSHNMGAIKALCTKGILLENGMVKEAGDIDKVTERYFKKEDGQAGYFTPGKFDKNDKVIVEEVFISNQKNIKTESFNVGDDLVVELKFSADQDYDNPYVFVGIKSNYATVTAANTMIDGIVSSSLVKGENKIRVTFKDLPLLPQEYHLFMGMRMNDGKTPLMETKDIATFAVVTRMKDLGIDEMLSEELASQSVSPMIPYEWDFGNGNKRSFNILNNVKK
ncbi:MAG: ABC transporter ATP-binding protein [Bacteroidetes bacterium]|nr:ABC transporter ATP-binding protein [Bacteroidota bacterium]